MKKLILIAVIAVVGAAGAGYWFYIKSHNPIATAKALADSGDMKGAELVLRNAVKADPKNAEAHYQLGSAHLMLGDAVAAEKEFKAARENGRTPGSVAYPLGEAYLAQGRFADLLKEIPADAAAPADKASLLVLRSQAQIGLGDLDGAQASVVEAEKLEPASADPQVAAARLAIARNDNTAVDAAVQRALALDPHRSDALILRAQMQSLKGDRTGAIASLDAAIAAVPKLAVARLRRAELLIAAGQDAKAKEDITEVQAAEPNNATAVYFAMVLQARAGEWAAANESLQRLTSIAGKFPAGYYYAALIKGNVGEIEQALDAAVKYHDRAPNDPDGAKLLARIAITAGQPDRAIDVLGSLIAAGNTDPDLESLLGRAQVAIGKPQQAVHSFELAAGLPTGFDAKSTQRVSTSADAATTGEAGGKATTGTLDAEQALILASIASGDIERATAVLERLRKQVGDVEEVRNLDGLVKLARFDVSGALAEFQELLKAHPDSIQAKLNLAKVLTMQGNRAEAKKLLLEVTAKQPTNEPALSGLIVAMLQDNQTSDAIGLMEAAHKAEPDNAAMTAALSDLYIRAGDAKKSIQLLDENVSGQGTNPVLQAARARALLAQDKPADARDAYRQVLVLNPGDYETRRRLVDIMVGMKDFDGAKNEILEGLKVKPGDPQLLQAYVAIDLRGPGGVDAALKSVDKLREDPANMPAVLTLKGDVLMAVRRFGDAAAAYDTELKAHPTSEELTIRKAIALGTSGHPDQSADLLRAWLAKNPDSIAANQLLASIDIPAGRLDTAATSLEKILAKVPNQPVALNNLAWIYQKRGDPRAVSLAQRAYLISSSAQTADTLGWILASQGQAANAVPLLRQASAQMKDDPSVAYHLAYALNATGDKQGAETILKAALMNQKAFDERADAQKLEDAIAAGK